MAQRVAAIFHSQDAAQRAADALADLGADRGHISMLARGEEGMATTTAAPRADDRDDTDFVEPAREVGDDGAPMTTTDEDHAAAGAAAGAGIGLVAGLAAGAMALLVPGVGLVMAAGPLAWALGGAAGATAAGAIAGGVFGGLQDIGIEEKHARGYEERIRSGDVLLTALVPSIAEDRILDVLSQYGAEDVSFADDTSISRMPVSPEATITSPDYRTTNPADLDAAMPRTPVYETTERVDRDFATTTPSSISRVDTAPTVVPPTTTSVGSTTTMETAYNQDIARGEAKQIEGEMRDRAADFTANPMDDVAAKGEKVAGKVQERWGETRDAVGAAATARNLESETVRREQTASYADSGVGSVATTGAAPHPDIARGEAKQVEGEIRDRAADATANPMDDLAAKGKKLEGKVQEEVGEVEETIEPRRP